MNKIFENVVALSQIPPSSLALLVVLVVLALAGFAIWVVHDVVTFSQIPPSSLTLLVVLAVLAVLVFAGFVIWVVHTAYRKGQ